MQYYEELYIFKNNKKFVQRYLHDFLLFQIYSVSVLRQAYPNWPATRWYLRENTPLLIQELIEKSPFLSNEDLQLKLNEYYISQAVSALSSYQACDTPITQDSFFPQNRYKLTSKKGDKALSVLKIALQKRQFSDKMADLAIRTGHKFLFKQDYYIDFKFPKWFAGALTKKHQMIEDNSVCYIFPAIQLTKGCMNHCSHCDSRAEPHLSHMPWPVFCSLYRNLNRYYRHYPQKTAGHYFSSFFADSDMLDYHDPYMQTDSGDVGLWIHIENGHCQYLTRGVKNTGDKLSLAKALVSGQPIAFSFVDTPLENMTRNLQQLDETLDTVQSVPERAGMPPIIHRHLKSGSSVDKKVFRDFPVEDKIIYRLGRAKDFPPQEVNHFPDNELTAPCLIEPNGNITDQKIQNSEIVHVKLNNLFRTQMGPKINPLRLFIRQHASI